MRMARAYLRTSESCLRLTHAASGPRHTCATTAPDASMSTPAWPLRIYYDRSCPLCAQEMHALAAHDRAGRLELADCSAARFDEARELGGGATREQLMAIIKDIDEREMPLLDHLLDREHRLAADLAALAVDRGRERLDRDVQRRRHGVGRPLEHREAGFAMKVLVEAFVMEAHRLFPCLE